MSKNRLRTLLIEALDRGKVYIHVNPRVDGVDLPVSLMGRERVPLIVAWRAPQIDLQLGEHTIDATLRFAGQPYRCVIPWAALVAIISDHPQSPEASVKLRVVDGGSEAAEQTERTRPTLKLLED